MNNGILRALGALGVIIALGVVAGGTGASAADQTNAKAKAKVATITAEVEGKGRKARLFFEGPRSVKRGQILKVKSKTKYQQVGPHTFTLVKGGTLPKTKKEINGCYQLEGICGAGFEWHEVEFDPEDPDAPPSIGRVFVEAGKKGWDTEGSLKREGDSVLLQEAGQPASFKQVVSAKKGEKLTYICLVHPEMQGKIKVK